MSVTSATTFLPMRSPVSTISSARCSTSSSRLHERARAGLHIEHERVDPFRQLLAHDRSANQYGLSTVAGNVAQRINFFIRRRDLAPSARSIAQPHSRSTARNSSSERLTSKSGNRFQLVERAAGVAEPAAADHRHVKPGRRDDRRENQRRLVADAARRVLVHFLAPGNRRNRALRPSAASLRSAPPSPRATTRAATSHQPRRHLIIGNSICSVFGNERTDFVRG